MGDRKLELKNVINSSTKLNPQDKKELGLILGDEVYRDKLSRKISGMLLEQAVKKPGNISKHDKLGFVHTETEFLKNCITIIKNI